MATNRELDILSRLLNPDRMEDELLDERSIEAETPLNPASPVTDEEVSVAAANNVVEAFNAPDKLDRQIAGEIAKSPMDEAARQMPDRQLAENLQDLKTGESETLDKAASERELMLQEYKDLIKQRKDLMTAKKPEQSTGDQVMNWLTAAGQAASSIAPRRAPIGDVQYWGDLTKKQDAAARKEKLGQLEGLQSALKDYLSATKKDGKDGLSARDEAYLEYYNEKLDLQKQQLNKQLKAEDRLQDKFGHQKAQKLQDDARDALKDLRGTDTWKTGEAAVAEIETIESLLDDAYKEGGQSLAMIGPKIAKGIAGEVGVLTEQDVKRYTQNPQLIESMMDTLTRVKSGKLTEASYDNLKRLMEISKKTARSKIDRALDREATILARREGIPYEDARYYLDSEYEKESLERKQAYVENTLEGKVRVELPNGQKGSINRDKLEAFKKKYPEAKILD